MNTNILRIFDVNINRLREALRVSEDCMRFVYNKPLLASQLRKVRHRATHTYLQLGDKFTNDCLQARDTARDPGRSIKWEQALRSDALHSVCMRNMQRAKESSRVLEELSKGISPKAWASFKKLRFEIYANEKRINKFLATVPNNGLS